MDTETELLRFYNCTEDILNSISSETWNATQLLELLPGTLTQDAALNSAITECLWPATPRPYQPPWWGQLAWLVVFAAMILVAVLGNAIVIWIVVAHRRMRTITNCFLVNLAIADLLMATLNGAPNFVFLVTAHWPFGAATCVASTFTANLTVSASVFTLVAISIDRYVAIVRPLHHRLSRRVARGVLVAVWLGSALLALPCLLYSATMTKRYANGEWREVCYMLWPDGRYPSSKSEYIYNLVFLSVTYVFPVGVMVGSYVQMGRVLWGRAIGERTMRQMQVVRAKRKVVRMFVIVMGVFTLCWLPYHAFFVLVYHHAALASAPAAQHVYLAFYWLAMANAMFNPLIYYWMNNRFRVYFQQVLCACRVSITEVPNGTSKQQELNRSFSVSQKHVRDVSLVSRG